MRTIMKTISVAVVAIMLTAGLPVASFAQYTSDSTVRELVRTIQSRTDNLRRIIQNADNRRDLSGAQVFELNRLIGNFSSATTQLDRRLASSRATTSDARLVMDRAALIDNFFVTNRLGFAAEREWQSLRNDLDDLARAYNMNWQWGSGPSTGTDYYLSDSQFRQLVNRIDNRTSNFSRFLRQDLYRRGVTDRYSADQVRQELSQYESAVMQLRSRTNARQVKSNDARDVLSEAIFLNNYVGDVQLSSRTETQWNLLRRELDQLARAFNMSWNWSSQPDYVADGALTGTYRLNNSRGDDVRRVADEATRTLPENQRQRAYDSLINRLDPPNMLAIDQRGTAVTIASTRAPRINFIADGREQVETNPAGGTVRVRASLSGNDRLVVTRTGDRAQDFTVTFESINNDRQLLVTRQLYSDRFNQPVVVRSYYDKSSEVAQLNLYETNPEYAPGDVASGDFVVPNGTEIVGVLNTELTTKDVRENDRFTLTVRTPGQFQGATINGYVTGVDRAGRITGRSELTLNFDTIRLRDGRSYRFAGILESVRTPNGEVVRVDTEGAVRDDDSQTSRTVTRTAIGTAVGAIIGAITGGGKGAAIGAAIGAGAGAGSVYVQGREDLELPAGTEITVKATGPRN